MPYRRIGFAVVLLSCVASAHAEPVPASVPETPYTNHDLRTLSPADNEHAGGLPTSALALTASGDDKGVALTLTSKDNGQLRRGGDVIWSLTLKAPFDKDENVGAFATERGLASDFAAEFQFTRISAPLGRMNTGAELAVAEWLDKCPKDVRRSPEWQALAALSDEKREAAQEKLVADECRPGSGDFESISEERLLKHIPPALVKALLDDRKILTQHAIGILNVGASIGYNRFKFFSPTSFSETDLNRVPFAASISYGINPSRDAPFFGVGYEYKREYKAADKRVVCPVNAVPQTPTACQFDAFDSPKTVVSHDVFGVLRYATGSSTGIPSGFRLPVAVEIRGAYDLHNKIASVAIPVYFLLDNKGEFRGGAKFSWANRTTDSNRDDFKFSIFIVKSFDFFHLQ